MFRNLVVRPAACSRFPLRLSAILGVGVIVALSSVASADTVSLTSWTAAVSGSMASPGDASPNLLGAPDGSIVTFSNGAIANRTMSFTAVFSGPIQDDTHLTLWLGESTGLVELTVVRWFVGYHDPIDSVPAFLAFADKIYSGDVTQKDWNLSTHQVLTGGPGITPFIVLVPRPESSGAGHDTTKCCMKVSITSTSSAIVPVNGVRSQRPL